MKHASDWPEGQDGRLSHSDGLTKLTLVVFVDLGGGLAP